MELAANRQRLGECVNMHLPNPLRATNIAIMFHNVHSADWFRRAIATIQSIYKIISIEDIKLYYYGHKEFINCCHICFDDGTRNFYENAFGVLKQMNIPATLFVSPDLFSKEFNYWFQELGCIRSALDDVSIKRMICEMTGCNFFQIKKYGVLSIFKCMRIEDILRIIETLKKKYNIRIDERYNMNKEELYEVSRSKVITIGAHTVNHPVLSNESFETAGREIRESIKQLRGILNRDVEYFAYPNGTGGLDYGAREQQILKEEGIKLAFTTDVNFFDKKTEPLAIPRCGFSGARRENKPWIVFKILLVPIWDDGRRIIKVKSEYKEVREIKACHYI